MATEIRVEGIPRFSAAIEKKIAEVNIAAKTFVTVGGQIVVKNSRRLFTSVVMDSSGNQSIAAKGSRNGRLVRRGRHIGPEGAGDPPHIRTGTLARSITTKDVREVGKGTWSSRTGPTANYGRRVELGFRGTDSKGRTYDEPSPFHPYLKPGLEMSAPELKELRRRLFEVANNG